MKIKNSTLVFWIFKKLEILPYQLNSWGTKYQNVSEDIHKFVDGNPMIDKLNSCPGLMGGILSRPLKMLEDQSSEEELTQYMVDIRKVSYYYAILLEDYDISKNRDEIKKKLDYIYSKYSNDLSIDEFKYISKYSDLLEVTLIDIILSTNLRNTKLTDYDYYKDTATVRDELYLKDLSFTNKKCKEVWSYVSEISLLEEDLKYSFLLYRNMFFGPERYLEDVLSKYRGTSDGEKFNKLLLNRFMDINISLDITPFETSEEYMEVFKGCLFNLNDFLKDLSALGKIKLAKWMMVTLELDDKYLDKIIKKILVDFKWDRSSSLRTMYFILFNNSKVTVGDKVHFDSATDNIYWKFIGLINLYGTFNDVLSALDYQSQENSGGIVFNNIKVPIFNDNELLNYLKILRVNSLYTPEVGRHSKYFNNFIINTKTLDSHIEIFLDLYNLLGTQSDTEFEGALQEYVIDNEGSLSKARSILLKELV